MRWPWEKGRAVENLYDNVYNQGALNVFIVQLGCVSVVGPVSFEL